ncbi:MAG: hypothetical protein R2823_01625 [Acidimicrobiia bacterium]
MTSHQLPETGRYSEPDAVHKTLVRLIVGGIGEGVERLMTIAEAIDQAESDPASVAIGPIRANPSLMAMIGWVSEMPSVARTVARATATRPMARAVGVAWNTVAFVAAETGVTSFVDGLTKPTREAILRERDRLAAVGVGEYARGRVLAVGVFEQSIDGVVGYLGTSDELGELVREQTLGITGSAVRELRETGAAADGLAEGIFRRLVGRKPRGVPPLPVTDAP